MKVFIVLFALFACALASGLGGHYEAAPIVSKVLNVNTGHSNQYRSQDGWGNYKFGYDEQHHDSWGSGGSSRHETGDAWGNKEGSYSLNVGDGRQRVVKYVADGAGFRASIKTNEPGIVSSAPAAVDINTPHGHGLHGGELGIAHSAPVLTKVGGYSEGLGLAGNGLALGGYSNGLGLAGNGLGLAGGYGNGLGLAGNGLGLAGGYGNGGLALGGAY